jgi:hypothetical protein
MTLKHLNRDSIEQYQTEERTMMAFRLASARYRISDLLGIMKKDHISTTEKTKQLASELAVLHQKPSMARVQSMGELVRLHMKYMLSRSLKLIPKLQTRED